MAGAETWPIVAASAVTAIATLGATWLANLNQDSQRRRQLNADQAVALQGHLMALILQAGELRGLAARTMLAILANDPQKDEMAAKTTGQVNELQARALTFFPALNSIFDDYEAALAAKSAEVVPAIQAGDTAKIWVINAALADLAKDLAYDVHQGLLEHATELNKRLANTPPAGTAPQPPQP